MELVGQGSYSCHYLWVTVPIQLTDLTHYCSGKSVLPLRQASLFKSRRFRLSSNLWCWKKVTALKNGSSSKVCQFAGWLANWTQVRHIQTGETRNCGAGDYKEGKRTKQSKQRHRKRAGAKTETGSMVNIRDTDKETQAIDKVNNGETQ